MFLSDHATHISDLVDVIDNHIDCAEVYVTDLTVTIHGNKFGLKLNSDLEVPDYEITDLGPDPEAVLVHTQKPSGDSSEDILTDTE